MERNDQLGLISKVKNDTIKLSSKYDIFSPSSSMSMGSGRAGLVSGAGSISPGRSFLGSSLTPSPSFFCA